MTCSCDAAWSADLSALLDLEDTPYTVRCSRLLVRRGTAGLDVLRSVYERRLADSLVLRDLQVRDEGGASVPVDRACATCVHLGPARLLVTPDDRIVVRALPPGWSVSAQQITDEARLVIEEPGHEDRELAAVEADAACVADDWMGRCPAVRPQDRAMTRLCWWVLGVNTLPLGGAAPGRAVVPSKIGYVGLWQWDAYFIAIGLRHGDTDLAAEQLRLALSRPGADGQLPDVLHEQGVLASSDDLPPGDLENLRAMASPALEGTRIPLTKPPLTALAVQLLAEQLGRADAAAIIDELGPVIGRSQQWWFEGSDPGATGVPAYLHPYSSGLDDSPVFDHDAILRSPDLTAYLVLQDRLLADWAQDRGRDESALQHRRRAQDLLDRLEEAWDPAALCYRALGADGQVPVDAIIGLMPLLCEGLPDERADPLVTALTDPVRYGATVPAPTVSGADPAFDEELMWRGPVWVNTNWLLIRGLETQGRIEAARVLREATLTMVREGGGPHEYFSSRTGHRAPGATTCFGWSAALFVDLAVAAA